MAVAAGANQDSHTTSLDYPNLAQDNEQRSSPSVVPEWTEDSPSYLTHVQVLLAGLTEADKDAIHASLEEE